LHPVSNENHPSYGASPPDKTSKSETTLSCSAAPAPKIIAVSEVVVFAAPFVDEYLIARMAMSDKSRILAPTFTSSRPLMPSELKLDPVAIEKDAADKNETPAGHPIRQTRIPSIDSSTLDAMLTIAVEP
jgi:hypothetical protein